MVRSVIVFISTQVGRFNVHTPTVEEITGVDVLGVASAWNTLVTKHNLGSLRPSGKRIGFFLCEDGTKIRAVNLMDDAITWMIPPLDG